MNVADMKSFAACTSVSRYLHDDNHSAQHVHEDELNDVCVNGEEVSSSMFLGAGDGV